jgi:hypothetical protein
MPKNNKHPKTFSNFEPAPRGLINMIMHMEVSIALRMIITLVLIREIDSPKYTVIPKDKKKPVKFKPALKGLERFLS